MNLKEEVMRDEYGRVFLDVEELAAVAAGGGFETQYVQKVDRIMPDTADTFNLIGPRVSGRMYIPAGVYYARGVRDGQQVSLLFFLNSRAEAIRMGDVVPVRE